MNNSPKIFITILNFNDKQFLNDCLESVLAIDYPNFEVVLVDNNSQDGSFESAKEKFPQITFFQNEDNLGFAKANNIGIKYALKKGADYVLLLNDDTLVEKNFLSKLAEVAEKDKKTGIICPLIYKGDKKSIWFSRGKIDWLRMKTIHETKLIPAEYYQSDFITGCAILIRNDVLENVGLLDEDYFLYWEDADFCFRVQKSGFATVVVPDSIIYHFEASEKTSEKKTYWLVFSALLFFRKNCPGYLRPWVYCYVKLRKAKNWFKRRFSQDKLAGVVYKAYKDFDNARK